MKISLGGRADLPPPWEIGLIWSKQFGGYWLGWEKIIHTVVMKIRERQYKPLGPIAPYQGGVILSPASALIRFLKNPLCHPIFFF